MSQQSTGTVLITGANGSCAIPFISHIKTHYPDMTIIATVRNASPDDPNTAHLSSIIPPSSIEPLDLSLVAAVNTFTAGLSRRVETGELPPIKAIVCNAFTMSLKDQIFTSDGFEQTFQVNHLAHYLLVLKLLGSMASDGRIVMLSSNTHYTDRKHPLFDLPVRIPDNIEKLVKPGRDTPGKEYSHGFQRYGVSKLANIMFMHDLNARLAKNPKLSGITAVAMDPGGMVDSRAHKIQTPLIRFVFGLVLVLLPILKYFTYELRTAAQSGQELAELAVGDEYKGTKGYFMGLRREKEDPICEDANVRDVLWKACWRWAGLKKEDTVLEE
ncbi:uncharacterized protein B0J16DRAFT_380498 [Fusarium flagelliforme]|uniref:uncharacterized protein n=1 Tax=Fusarium flagelliforme TaxID=2675880 RepID=UPI001E8E3B9F|nr:uncharacterized protein B0J16DRAFT_380498 [Fusarium flagelliforme]KAH7192611.1 hypothetical protein B0J16DRAFT_380498 [Fusarium flagelliforme]